MPTRKSYAVGGGIKSLPTWREIPNDYIEIDSQPEYILNAESTLWGAGGTAAEMYHLWFYLNNRNVGVVNVTLGRAYGGGVLGAGEYWLNSEPINGPGVYGWEGPFQVAGNDLVRGHDNGAGGNLVSFHVRIKRKW